MEIFSFKLGFLSLVFLNRLVFNGQCLGKKSLAFLLSTGVSIQYFSKCDVSIFLGTVAHSTHLAKALAAPLEKKLILKNHHLPISNRHLFTHQIVNFKNKIRPEQLPSLNGNHSECNSHSTQRARLREIKVSRSHQNRSGQYLSAWSGARSGGHQGVLLQDVHSQGGFLQGVHCHQGDHYHPSPGVGQGFECRTPLVYLLST